MDPILVKIELLRKQMNVEAMKKGICHGDVLRLSQRLDAYLNQYQKLHPQYCMDRAI